MVNLRKHKLESSGSLLYALILGNVQPSTSQINSQGTLLLLYLLRSVGTPCATSYWFRKILGAATVARHSYCLCYSPSPSRARLGLNCHVGNKSLYEVCQGLGRGAAGSSCTRRFSPWPVLFGSIPLLLLLLLLQQLIRRCYFR